MAPLQVHGEKRHLISLTAGTSFLTQVKQDWNNVALLIPGASSHSCMFKFIGLKKFKLAQHKWQKDEETLLLAII
jgi:hypothetical protein